MKPFRPSRLLLALALLLAGTMEAQIAPASSSAVPAASSGVRHRTARAAAPVGPNLDVVVLDPGHGRQDPGGRIGPNLLEKDLDLSFAQRLRAALSARGFSVVLTREADPVQGAPTPNPDPTLPPIPAPTPAPLTPDTRAEIANRAHPLACLLLHATSAGRGLHLYTSSLTPVTPLNGGQDAAQPKAIQLWDTAQAAFLPQSQRLLADLSLALRNGNFAVLSGSASVSPIDSMSCPAITLELAPASAGRGAVTPPSDTGYQDRVIAAVVDALQTFRSEVAASQPKPVATPNPVPPKQRPASRAKPAVPNGTEAVTR